MAGRVGDGVAREDFVVAGAAIVAGGEGAGDGRWVTVTAAPAAIAPAATDATIGCVTTDCTNCPSSPALTPAPVETLDVVAATAEDEVVRAAGATAAALSRQLQLEQGRSFDLRARVGQGRRLLQRRVPPNTGGPALQMGADLIDSDGGQPRPETLRLA